MTDTRATVVITMGSRIKSGHAPPPDRTIWSPKYQGHNRRQQRSTRRTPTVRLETLEKHSKKWKRQNLFFNESTASSVDYDEACTLPRRFPEVKEQPKEKKCPYCQHPMRHQWLGTGHYIWRCTNCNYQKTRAPLVVDLSSLNTLANTIGQFTLAQDSFLWLAPRLLHACSTLAPRLLHACSVIALLNIFGCHKAKSYSPSQIIPRHATHPIDRYDSEFCKRICRRIRGWWDSNRCFRWYRFRGHGRNLQKSTRRTPTVRLETLEKHSKKNPEHTQINFLL